jgi:hypothetical protein
MQLHSCPQGSSLIIISYSYFINCLQFCTRIQPNCRLKAPLYMCFCVCLFVCVCVCVCVCVYNEVPTFQSSPYIMRYVWFCWPFVRLPIILILIQKRNNHELKWSEHVKKVILVCVCVCVCVYSLSNISYWCRPTQYGYFLLIHLLISTSIPVQIFRISIVFAFPLLHQRH